MLVLSLMGGVGLDLGLVGRMSCRREDEAVRYRGKGGGGGERRG